MKKRHVTNTFSIIPNRKRGKKRSRVGNKSTKKQVEKKKWLTWFEKKSKRGKNSYGVISNNTRRFSRDGHLVYNKKLHVPDDNYGPRRAEGNGRNLTCLGALELKTSHHKWPSFFRVLELLVHYLCSLCIVSSTVGEHGCLKYICIHEFVACLFDTIKRKNLPNPWVKTCVFCFARGPTTLHLILLLPIDIRLWKVMFVFLFFY